MIVLAHTRYEFGYHLVLCAVSMDDIDPIEVEISLVGAGLGGVFEHTFLNICCLVELHVF